MDSSQPSSVSTSTTPLVQSVGVSSFAFILPLPYLLMLTEIIPTLMSLLCCSLPLLLPSILLRCTPLFPFPTHQVISLKLTNINYLYWRMQMKPYLLGQWVFQFVDGSFLCLPPYVFAADGTSLQVNHSFFHWNSRINSF